MSKYFKPYLYFVYFLGIAALLIAYSKGSFQFSLSLFILSIFIIISEIKSINLSKNSSFSLLGIFAVFSLYISPPFSAMIALALSLFIVVIIRVFITKECDKLFNVKFFFNLAMHLFCLYMAYLFGFLLLEKSPLNLIIGIAIYNILNKLMLFVIIKLYSNDPYSLKITKDQIKMAYYYILISLLLYYSNHAYQELGIILICTFIISYQSSALNMNYIGEITENIYKDSLTKADNRTSLNNIIRDKLLNKSPFSIIFLDFDNFKGINDSYGHNIGDKVLIHFTTTIKDLFDSKVYRYGGDEFCIILNQNENPSTYIKAIQDEKNMFKVPYKENEITYSVTCGFYTYTGENLSIEDIFDYSSHAMHSNKVVKRNC